MSKTTLNDGMLENVSGGAAVPYVPNPGETLHSVANRLNIPVQKLMNWNGIQDPNAPIVGKLIVKR